MNFDETLPNRVTVNSPTMSPAQSPGPTYSECDSEVSSPTFAPRKLAGIGNTIFRVGQINEAKSMFNAAINSHSVDATGLMKARTQIRNISKSDMAIVVKNGKKNAAKEGPVGDLRFKYEYNHLIFITDETGQTGYSCWKNIITLPKATSQYEIELINACCARPCDLEKVKCNIEVHAVTPNITCSKGLTPLMHSCRNLYSSADVSVLKYLLSIPGVDIDYPSEQGNRSALHWAVIFGSPIAVELLLSAGACPHVQDAEGKTPIEVVSSVVLEDGPTGTPDADVRIATIQHTLQKALDQFRSKDESL